MAEKVNTNTLMKRLFKANDLSSYLLGNEGQLYCPDFCALLKELCNERNLYTHFLLRLSHFLLLHQ